ncbi:hypothetical protein ACFLU6_12930 [Acidobacteriota bacterium]
MSRDEEERFIESWRALGVLCGIHRSMPCALTSREKSRTMLNFFTKLTPE